MSDPPLAPGDRPRLARKARLRNDPTRDATVLLYPEGVLVLNPTAGAVIALCDGRRSVAAIAAELGGRYRTQADAIAADVAELLGRLRDRGLVELTPQGDAE